MGYLMKIIVGMGLFLSLSACSSKSDSQKAVDDANRSIEQAKRDADKAAEDAKKAADDAANASKKANESTLDAVSSGGQPGTIFLAGALVNENALDAQITVNITTGMGWRGQKPDVNDGILQLRAKLSDSSAQEIEKIKDDNTFVNFGCDTTTLNDLNGLEEKQVESSSSPVMIVKAKFVLICDGGQLNSGMTLLTADTVVLADFQYEMTGAVDKSFSITTNNLIIKGNNSISSKGKDGSSTLLQGPSISIATYKISGNGKIDIKAEGSSYKTE